MIVGLYGLLSWPVLTHAISAFGGFGELGTRVQKWGLGGV